MRVQPVTPRRARRSRARGSNSHIGIIIGASVVAVVGLLGLLIAVSGGGDEDIPSEATPKARVVADGDGLKMTIQDRADGTSLVKMTVKSMQLPGIEECPHQIPIGEWEKRKASVEFPASDAAVYMHVVFRRKSPVKALLGNDVVLEYEPLPHHSGLPWRVVRVAVPDVLTQNLSLEYRPYRLLLRAHRVKPYRDSLDYFTYESQAHLRLSEPGELPESLAGLTRIRGADARAERRFLQIMGPAREARRMGDARATKPVGRHDWTDWPIGATVTHMTKTYFSSNNRYPRKAIAKQTMVARKGAWYQLEDGHGKLTGRDTRRYRNKLVGTETLVVGGRRMACKIWDVNIERLWIAEGVALPIKRRTVLEIEVATNLDEQVIVEGRTIKAVRYEVTRRGQAGLAGWIIRSEQVPGGKVAWDLSRKDGKYRKTAELVSCSSR